MITTSKWLGLLAVAFVAGSFIASPELRAYAANTVFSTDIVDGEVKTADLAGNAVTAAKIRDNEVKAAEIAANAVGASELQGVTKLQYTACSVSLVTTRFPGEVFSTPCAIPGMSGSDKTMVTKEHGNTCFVLSAATPDDHPERDGIIVWLANVCDTNQVPGTITFSVIVYKPG